LRLDHPLLNRPFILNGINLQKEIVNELLIIRSDLLKKKRVFKSEVNQIVDKSGKIVSIESIIKLNHNGTLSESVGHLGKLLRAE
jgi:Icc-related predicted phosphoesterase